MSSEVPLETGPAGGDVQQVRDLYARYAYAYDQGQADEFAALFAEDGEFEVVGGPVLRGSAALAGMVRAAAARPGRSLHLVSNVLVQVTGDRATGLAYVVLLAIGDGDLRVVTVGAYDDSFVRGSHGWVLARRRFEPLAGPDPLGIPITGRVAADVEA